MRKPATPVLDWGFHKALVPSRLQHSPEAPKPPSPPPAAVKYDHTGDSHEDISFYLIGSLKRYMAPEHEGT